MTTSTNTNHTSEPRTSERRPVPHLPFQRGDRVTLRVGLADSWNPYDQWGIVSGIETVTPDGEIVYRVYVGRRHGYLGSGCDSLRSYQLWPGWTEEAREHWQNVYRPRGERKRAS